MSDALHTLFSTHLPALAVLLPGLTAMVLLLIGDGGGRERLQWRRWVSLASVALGLIVAARLVVEASHGPIHVYRMGDWPAPFGIVLVIDRLSAMMLLLTQLVALPVLVYACGGWDSHGRYFHAIFQFQLMGLAGAFATGDLFNLFVFFEVLLIASYVLLVHGQGRQRLRMGVHYVVLNLGASVLFLVGVALIYGLTGTLNMADLALRVEQVGPAEVPVLRAAALVLLVVFGLKAALVPLYFWLPGTYAAASAPVAALFAIMTKVGVYSIVRVHGTIFGADAGGAALVVEPWLLPAALLTGMLGVLGALAAQTLSRLVAYLTVASIGTILAGVGLFTPQAWAATFYYLVHSTLAIAALFLLAELVAAQRGEAADGLRPAGPVAQPTLLSLLLLLAAASTAGLPPLPGFLGKVMILDAASGAAAQPWVWSVVLIVGFFTIVGLARAGSILFWKAVPDPDTGPTGGASGASPKLILATMWLLAASVAMAAFASPLKRYTDAAALQLTDRAAYARAVLGPLGEPGADTRQPYRIERHQPGPVPLGRTQEN